MHSRPDPSSLTRIPRMEPTPPTSDPRPPITERDISWHQALAGIAAREAAQAAGGSLHQLRALIHTAEGGIAFPPTSGPSLQPSSTPCLKGFPLRDDDLLVTLCFGLHARAFGHDPRAHWADEDTARRMTAIATLGFLFTRTKQAWDLLDQATDPDATEDQQKTARRAFRLIVTEFAAEFTAQDIATLTTHLLTLAGFTPAAEDQEAAPQAAGEPSSPPQEPSWWHRLARPVAGLWRILRPSWPSMASLSAELSVSPFPPVSPSSKPAPPASTLAKASATSTAPSSPPGTPPAAAS